MEQQRAGGPRKFESLVNDNALNCVLRLRSLTDVLLKENAVNKKEAKKKHETDQETRGRREQHSNTERVKS